MAYLTCENLTMGYEGKIVFEDISFSINQGDYVSIVGENGSGKSTLVKTLLRLEKPIGGKITLGDGLWHNQIGYLPQQSEIQKDFPASVMEVVMSGFLSSHRVFPFYKNQERKKALKIMDMLGISSLAKKSYRELSGGQQQRVFLARALCATNKMLVLDEPVAGLDPKVTAQMYDIINTLNHEKKVTIIMISHDVRAAIKYSSHILHIGHNSVFFGTKDQYMKSETGQKFLL